MLRIHNFDHTGVYTGSTDIPPRPVGVGLPAGCTTVAPPETPTGNAAVWNGSAWTIAEDHRGRAGYVNGKPYTITEIGPLPAGFTEEKPAPVLTLEEAKVDAVQKVKDAGYEAEIKGLIIQGMAIPTDRDSQSLITGAVVGTLLEPGKVTRWQTATTHEGIPVFIELSAEQLQAIGKAVRSYVQSCFDTRDAKFTEIAALDTPEAVAAWLEANLKTGWPK